MTADSPAVVASFTPQLEHAREAFLSAGQKRPHSHSPKSNAHSPSSLVPTSLPCPALNGA